MERRERNLIIFGQTPVEKCVLANVLASTKHEKCRIFQAKNFNNRHITVRSFWSTFIKNTRLILFVVPKKDCGQYIEFLEKMKSYRNRFIFYVLNSTNIHDYDPVQEVRTLMSNIGTHRTRYIPVVYRDSEHLRAPINKQEQSFLNEFPGTHFHAPLIHDNSYGLTKQQMLFEYLQYTYQNEGPDCYGKYPSQEYLYFEYPTHMNPSLPEPEIGGQATALSGISLSDSGGYGLSTATDGGMRQTPLHKAENAADEDMPTESRTTDDKAYRELHDEDYALFDDALTQGITKSHHVRIMVVGPNGAGKTTLIKRLKMEYPRCPSLRPPTEGIDIEKTVIRCRVVNDILEWEVENSENDFRRTMDAQKIATAMQGVEKERIRIAKNRGNPSPPVIGNSSVTGNVGARFDDSVDGRRVGLENDEVPDDNERTDKALSQNVDGVADGNTKDNSSENDEAADDDSGLMNLSQNKEDVDAVDTDKNRTTEDNNSEKERLIIEALRQKEYAIVPWTFCSIWDFAGHAAYYSTHQMFLSSSNIYLLVVDLSKDLDLPIEHLPDTKNLGMFQMTEAESLKFWIGSIQQHASYSSDISICLVATHKDRIADSSMVGKRLTRLFDELQVGLDCFVLDNTQTEGGDEDDLHHLKKFIECSAYTLADENIPANWTEIEDNIDKTVQSVTDLTAILNKCPFREDTILPFLHYQHSRGDIYFRLKESACLSDERTEIGDGSVTVLNDRERQTPIFLDPTILIQFVNLILKRRSKENYKIGLRIQRFNVSYFPEGVSDDEYISEMLSTPGNDILLTHKDVIIKQLLELHILFKFRVDPKEFMFMPCLLRQQPPGGFLSCFERAPEQSTILVIRFTTSYVSQVVFHQLVAALHDYYTPLIKKENDVDKFQVYCGYVSFNLSKTGLQQLQIYWTSHGIHLRISNLSETPLRTIVNIDGVTLGQTALDTTLDCLDEVISTNRNLPDYTLMVICPEHFMPPTLVPVHVLDEYNACLCPCEYPHELKKEDALECWTSPKQIEPRPVSHINLGQKCPTDKQLARIALALRVNTSVLKHVLTLEDANMETEHLLYTYGNNERMQTFCCLLKWKQENGNKAKFDLLRSRLGTLIKRREGDWISSAVLEVAQTRTYGLEADLLQTIPSDTDLSFCIGVNVLPARFYFLFLELGLPYAEIEQAKFEERGDFKDLMFKLLRKWKENNGERATFQTLLDIVSFVGMDTTAMVENIKLQRR